MAKVSTYLNFARETEEAFNFYKQVFNTDFVGGIMRFGDVPPQPGAPELPEEDKNLVMHCMLPIIGDHFLMGSDAPESCGFKVNPGNNYYIMLQPDTREETKKLFDALSEGGVIEQDLTEMFWGDYYGSLKDKFGVQWMFDCEAK
jgi:PhnB protein